MSHQGADNVLVPAKRHSLTHRRLIILDGPLANHTTGYDELLAACPTAPSGAVGGMGNAESPDMQDAFVELVM
jgi:hypothetical protein